MAKYLQLEYGSGNFFEYSKEEQEGYTKHTSSKGNVSYRKYHKGVTGVLDSVSIYDSRFGKQLSFTIKIGDELHYAPIDIRDQKGNVSDFAESVAGLLPNLHKGMNITLNPYNFTPKDSKYNKVGVSIKSDGVKVERALTNAYYKEGSLVKGDIPAVEWAADPIDETKRKPTATSLEAKNNYILKVIKEQTDRLGYVREESTQADPIPKKEEQKKEPATVNSSDNDDLPF